MNIPKGHQTVMPYLMVNGASKFQDFTKTVFSADETLLRLREDGKTVMHCEIQINGSTIMYCETTEDWKEQTANLFIYVEDADVTFQKALKAGGEVIMPLRTEDYGRTCGVKDPVGNTGWITSTKE